MATFTRPGLSPIERADDELLHPNGGRGGRAHLHGRLTWSDDGRPVAKVLVKALDPTSGAALGSARTDEDGGYHLALKRRPLGQALVVAAEPGTATTAGTSVTVPLRADEHSLQVDLQLPADGRPTRGRAHPQVLIGGIKVNAHELAKAGPQIAIDIARAFNPAFKDERVLARIARLSPDLVPATSLARTLCGTALRGAVLELVHVKGWPRDVSLEIERIWQRYGFGFTEQIYNSPNFAIHYYDDPMSPDAINPDTSSQQVIDPGTTTVLATLPAGAPPTYIKRIAFWLERALNTYITPPFSLGNPCAGGRVNVHVNSDPYGSASPPSDFYVNKALNSDLLADVLVHELFHMVQGTYAHGGGSWTYSMTEGGAVWAEDANTEQINRYLDEAGTNFNGTGVQAQPQLSLESAGYKCSLFWRYLSEQKSGIVSADDEPLPIALSNYGADVYGPIIQACAATSWNTDAIRSGIRALPFYQDFYDYGYLDAGRLDLLSGETILGNYALACYLKDLDENVPDRRFDFMEGQETIYMDEIVTEAPQPGDKLLSVAIAGTGNVTPTSAVSFNGTLNRFASNYFSLTLDPAVTNVQVAFSAPALTSAIFQLILLDAGGAVREIYRSDKSSYTKTFSVTRAGTGLSKVVAIVTSAASSGSFSINASSVAAAPDVMVTRWNSAATTEYEVDSRNWAWTWTSPDIYVDTDGDGIADGTVYFNTNNKLFIRLHNKGNQDATGISVQLFYQDASGGLHPGSWLPVQNTGGTVQSLSGLTLAQGAANQWSVDWSPSPSGTSHHFCIHAVVTVPGDPNGDNKRVMANFGNVVVPLGGFKDLTLVRRNLGEEVSTVRLEVIPRNLGEFRLSGLDLARQAEIALEPGASRVDQLRLQHQPERTVRQPLAEDQKEAPATRVRLTPDATASYAPDPRILPPGVKGRPMVTLVHTVDGIPQGGVTYMVTPGKKES